jgi:hypothetical protein
VETFRLSLWLVIGCFAALSSGAESKPNFSGIWKLSNASPSRSLIIDQNESELRFFQFIEDRLTMVKGPIDGQPHSQTVDGSPCDFLARWEGDSLYFETKRQSRDSNTAALYTQHVMRLANGKAMSLQRTDVTPRPGTFRETWERQDPLSGEIFLTGFDHRLKLYDRGIDLSSPEGNRLRCSIANALNDVPRAERECMAIAGKGSRSEFRDEARANLAEVYWRNGMVRKALQYWGFGTRLLYKKLAKYPEISVTHRGYARIRRPVIPAGGSFYP